MLRFLGWVFTLLVFGAIAVTGGVFYVLYFYGRGLPDFAQLKDYEPAVVSRLYANDGRLFAEYATENRVFIPIENIPRRVIDTFLAAEDKNFYEHPGLDFFGILRASIDNLKNLGSNRRPKGASTITQQVAKNLLMAEVASKVSYERKLKEAILAFRIEKALTKERILELYLNEIYLGGGSYGVASAALQYFDKSLDELTIAEAAFLAALPKAPNHYHPKRNPKEAKARRDWVITRMFEDGIITADEAIAAKQEPFNLKNPHKTDVVYADYFAEEVRRGLMHKYGPQILYEGGLTVRTTLDPKVQAIADRSLRHGLIEYDRRHGYRGPHDHIEWTAEAQENWPELLGKIPAAPGMRKWQLAVVLHVNAADVEIGIDKDAKGKIPLSELKWARKDLRNSKTGPAISKPSDVLKQGDVILVAATEKTGEYSLQQIPAVSGAIVAMDAYTGRVLAMAGGWSYNLSEFNCATQAQRQSGSAIKPFVYLAAMEKGFTPATIVSDSPITISLGYGLGEYSPKNVTERYYGPVPMRVGLQKSLNMLTVRLAHEYVGMRPIKNIIETFGVTQDVPMQLAMALGAGETTPLKLTNGYAMIANGGRRVEYSIIDRIQNRNGQTIFRSDLRYCPDCTAHGWQNQDVPNIEDHRPYLVDPRSAYQVISMMEGAVRNGSARRAQSIGKIVAAKTGTTNDERDAWTLGFTADGLVVGVFVGFANPRHMGKNEGGSRVALPIFTEFMTEALKDIPSIPFPTPPGIDLKRVNEMTGQSPQPGDKNVIWEVFKAGETPQAIPYRATFGQSHGVENHFIQSGEIPGSDEPLAIDFQSMFDVPQKPVVEGTGGIY